MWPFFWIFLLAGVGLLIAGRKLGAAGRRAESWPTTTGKLESCEVVERRASAIEDPSSWELQVSYTYKVHGVAYRSTRYAFADGDTRDAMKKRMIAAQLKLAPALVVRYDPARPSEAVLNTEIPASITRLGYFMLSLAGLSFLLASYL